MTDDFKSEETRGGSHAGGGIARVGSIGPPDGPLSGGGDDKSELHEIAEGGEVQRIQSGWRLAWREFADNRLALVGLGILVFFVLFCFLGPVVHPTNQKFFEVFSGNEPPSGKHILGTDPNGFDELGRIMLGGRTALEIGFFSAFMAIVIGTLYGAIAGLVGGFLDAVLMRFVDVLLSIPFLFIILILATKYSGTVVTISIILAIFSWLVPSRLIRGEVLSLRERDFVHASEVMGAKRGRLIFRHLIPNAMSVTVVNTTFLIADSILALSALGFLGYGLQLPTTSWGDMLGQAESYIQQGYWWLVYPVGACLVLVVMSCNLVGNGLRDAMDVRLRRR